MGQNGFIIWYLTCIAGKVEVGGDESVCCGNGMTLSTPAASTAGSGSETIVLQLHFRLGTGESGRVDGGEILFWATLPSRSLCVTGDVRAVDCRDSVTPSVPIPFAIETLQRLVCRG